MKSSSSLDTQIANVAARLHQRRHDLQRDRALLQTQVQVRVLRLASRPSVLLLGTAAVLLLGWLRFKAPSKSKQ